MTSENRTEPKTTTRQRRGNNSLCQQFANQPETTTVNEQGIYIGAVHRTGHISCQLNSIYTFNHTFSLVYDTNIKVYSFTSFSIQHGHPPRWLQALKEAQRLAGSFSTQETQTTRPST